MKVKMIIGLLVVLIVVNASIMPEDTKVPVHMNKPSVVLYQGEITQLRLVGAKFTVRWESENKAIASVSKEGFVTAVEPGETKVVASYKNMFFDCVVTVKDYTDAAGNTMYAGRNVRSEYSNTYVSVLGDSISTLFKYSREDYNPYYQDGNTDVNKMEDTWWGRVIKGLGANLLVDNSYSGARVTGKHKSAFNKRCLQLSALEKDPDIILFFGGINDYLHDVPIGTYDGKQKVPVQVNTFREAYSITLNRMILRYPHAKIYCMTLLDSNNGNQGNIPLVNHLGIGLWEYNKAIKDICESFGVEVIDVNKCGITYGNFSMYMVDYNPVTQRAVHPNKAGHRMIANYVLKQIR